MNSLQVNRHQMREMVPEIRHFRPTNPVNSLKSNKIICLMTYYTYVSADKINGMTFSSVINVHFPFIRKPNFSFITTDFDQCLIWNSSLSWFQNLLVHLERSLSFSTKEESMSKLSAYISICVQCKISKK